MDSAASDRATERMRNPLRKLYESEGYRVTGFTTDAERAQVTLDWDKRCPPQCGVCKRPMRIRRISAQFVSDLPLGPASCVRVKDDAVQGYCKDCGASDLDHLFLELRQKSLRR
jgi:hypothetical protein